VAVLSAAAMVGCGTAQAQISLYSETVVVDADGERLLFAADADLQIFPDTRVAVTDLTNLSGGERRRVEDQLQWTRAAAAPGVGSAYEGMIDDAIIDIRTLTLDSGAVVAGWSPRWRYVWPRDASFVAVAMAELGQYEDALALLEFLAGVQYSDGRFEARFLPDGTGVPDDRGIQLDGSGWVLWASGEVVARMPAVDHADALIRLHPLIARSSRTLRQAKDTSDGLPPPSPDFWETPASQPTLGTAAPWLAGARTSAELARRAGDDAREREMTELADHLAGAVHEHFAPTYPRMPGRADPDAAVAFLLPPFTEAADPEIVAAWRRAAQMMERPAGGVAPGAGWKNDGVSWTPQTSLFAWVAASIGQCADAEYWLDWLDAHRTPSGSLPEKVLADGSPAAVAPLTWTAAIVILAVAAWDENCR
jgi:GH15 family glucan-1,4-alpha-glucosidase